MKENKNTNLIFIGPEIKIIKRIKKIIKKKEEINFYQASSINELNNKFKTPLLVITSNRNICTNILKNNVNNHKIVLITSNEISEKEAFKLELMGICEVIPDSVNSKNLYYKTKLLIKSIEAMKNIDKIGKLNKKYSNKESKNINDNFQANFSEKQIISDDIKSKISKDNNEIMEYSSSLSLDEKKDNIINTKLSQQIRSSSKDNPIIDKNLIINNSKEHKQKEEYIINNKIQQNENNKENSRTLSLKINKEDRNKKDNNLLKIIDSKDKNTGKIKNIFPKKSTNFKTNKGINDKLQLKIKNKNNQQNKNNEIKQNFSSNEKKDEHVINNKISQSKQNKNKENNSTLSLKINKEEAIKDINFNRISISKEEKTDNQFIKNPSHQPTKEEKENIAKLKVKNNINYDDTPSGKSKTNLLYNKDDNKKNTLNINNKAQQNDKPDDKNLSQTKNINVEEKDNGWNINQKKIKSKENNNFIAQRSNIKNEKKPDSQNLSINKQNESKEVNSQNLILKSSSENTSIENNTTEKKGELHSKNSDENKTNLSLKNSKEDNTNIIKSHQKHKPINETNIKDNTLKNSKESNVVTDKISNEIMQSRQSPKDNNIKNKNLELKADQFKNSDNLEMENDNNNNIELNHLETKRTANEDDSWSDKETDIQELDISNKSDTNLIDEENLSEKQKRLLEELSIDYKTLRKMFALKAAGKTDELNELYNKIIASKQKEKININLNEDQKADLDTEILTTIIRLQKLHLSKNDNKNEMFNIINRIIGEKLGGSITICLINNSDQISYIYKSPDIKDENLSTTDERVLEYKKINKPSWKSTDKEIFIYPYNKKESKILALAKFPTKKIKNQENNLSLIFQSLTGALDAS